MPLPLDKAAGYFRCCREKPELFIQDTAADNALRPDFTFKREIRRHRRLFHYRRVYRLRHSRCAPHADQSMVRTFFENPLHSFLPFSLRMALRYARHSIKSFARRGALCSTADGKPFAPLAEQCGAHSVPVCSFSPMWRDRARESLC